MANTHLQIPFEVGPRSSELEGLDLGDERLNRRAKLVFERWSHAPESSLPQAMKEPSELEGAYRLFNNKRVDSDAVLAPHLVHSWERAAAASSAGLWVLSIEDTTEMRFGGTKQRHGLGALMNEGEGFYAHTALLACLIDSSSSGGIGVPLGVGACEILVRPKTRRRCPEGVSKNVWARQRHFADDNEFLRWTRVRDDVDQAAHDSGVEVVHVADREADEYAWLADIKGRGGRFVVRQTKNRRLRNTTDDATPQKLDELLSRAHPVRAHRQVSFEAASTSGGRRRRKQARKGRTTELEIQAVTAVVRRPSLSRADEKELEVNVVIVREVAPPEGASPIEWRLLTTEQIATEEDVLRVVDAYRARWLIEELFKAIKTGFNYERLQLETLHGLKIALSVVFPMAWQMLLLRTAAREAPDVPAAAVLTRTQFNVLMIIAASASNPWAVKLPDDPTAADIMYAVARMGGHLKHNGPPGWQTIGRGLRELQQVVRAHQLFLPRCDQS